MTLSAPDVELTYARGMEEWRGGGMRDEGGRRGGGREEEGEE